MEQNLISLNENCVFQPNVYKETNNNNNNSSIKNNKNNNNINKSTRDSSKNKKRYLTYNNSFQDNKSVFDRLYQEYKSDKKEKEIEELRKKYEPRNTFQPNYDSKNKNKPNRKDFEIRLVKHNIDKKKHEQKIKEEYENEFIDKFPSCPNASSIENNGKRTKSNYGNFRQPIYQRLYEEDKEKKKRKEKISQDIIKNIKYKANHPIPIVINNNTNFINNIKLIDNRNNDNNNYNYNNSMIENKNNDTIKKNIFGINSTSNNKDIRSTKKNKNKNKNKDINDYSENGNAGKVIKKKSFCFSGKYIDFKDYRTPHDIHEKTYEYKKIEQLYDDYKKIKDSFNSKIDKTKEEIEQEEEKEEEEQQQEEKEKEKYEDKKSKNKREEEQVKDYVQEQKSENEIEQKEESKEQQDNKSDKIEEKSKNSELNKEEKEQKIKESYKNNENEEDFKGMDNKLI